MKNGNAVLFHSISCVSHIGSRESTRFNEHTADPLLPPCSVQLAWPKYVVGAVSSFHVYDDYDG